jgi:hypothetical protein
LFLAGFLGEIILRTKNNEERYKVSKEINWFSIFWGHNLWPQNKITWRRNLRPQTL